jgi:hypothetical protein
MTGGSKHSWSTWHTFIAWFIAFQLLWSSIFPLLNTADEYNVQCVTTLTGNDVTRNCRYMSHLGWFQWHAYVLHVILSHAVTWKSPPQSVLTVTVHHATFPHSPVPRNMAANLHSALNLFVLSRQQTRLLYLEDGRIFLGNDRTFPLHTARRQNAVLFKWQVGPHDLLRVRRITKSRRPAPLVRPVAWYNSARTGHIFIKFDMSFLICRKNPSVIKISQEKRILYMKTYVLLW